MRDQGFSGSGNRFVTRFSSGEPVYADQLNDLASGIAVTLPQPYIGAGASVSFLAGGSVITSANDDGLTLSAVANLILGNEYVNHYETKVLGIDVGGGTLGIVLKVAKGGNIWRPVGSDCDQELRADVITTDGTLAVVTGTNPNSPWASSDGYIALTTGGSVTYYVYAYKVETDAGVANFYIYVSTDGTLDTACPVPIPTGIPTPTDPHTVQNLKVATVAWSTPLSAFTVDQHVVGSITWPSAVGAVVVEPEQFSIDIDQTASTFRIAKGNVISVTGGTKSDPYNPGFDGNFSTEQFQIIDFGVWKDGSRVVGTDASSPYMMNGGHINLVNFESGGSDAYRVCIILNRNKIVSDNPGSNLKVCTPYLAFFAIGGDGDLKTQPFKMSYVGGMGYRDDSQPYYDLVTLDREQVIVYSAAGDPSSKWLILWGGTGDGDALPVFKGFQNYNAQKVIVADIIWNATTSKWDIRYGSKGPITIPNNMTYAGQSTYKSWLGGAVPTWWNTPELETEQIAWESDYTDCTKWTTGPSPSVPL